MRPIFAILIFFFAGMPKFCAQVMRFNQTCAGTMQLPFTISGFDMAQDSAGLIYWASVDGLYAFDGFRTRLFRIDNSRFKKPQPQYVTSLYIDTYDVVWTGLRNGLARLDRQRGQLDLIATSETKFDDIAFPIFEDSKGNIWADTYDRNPANGNATRFNRKTGKATPYFIRMSDGKPLTERIVRMVEDELGLRGLTAEGSFVIRPLSEDVGIAEPLRWPGGLKNGHLKDLIAKDSSGNYWAFDSIGLLYYGKSLENLTRFDKIPEILNWHFPKLSVDKKNRVWIAGPGIAVFELATGAYQRIETKDCTEDGIPVSGVQFVFHDRHNVHWITHAKQTVIGQAILLTESPSRFGTWEPSEMPSHVFSIYREPESGEFWLGTYNSGVYHLDALFREKGHFSAAENRPSSLQSNKVIFLAPAGKNEIWFNCVPKGISRLNKKTGKISTVKAPDGAPYQECFLLKDGSLLLAAYNKSAIYDPTTGVFRQNQPVPVDSAAYRLFRFIQTVEEDGDFLWFGGYDKKIHRLNRIDGSLWTVPTDFIQHNVMALHRRGDSLYVGFLGQGLGIYNIPENRFVANFMTPEGFPHHTVYGILEDSKTRLWLFSSNGLTLFEPEKGHFTEFGLIDGLPWPGFNSGACFQDHTGLMYGGDEGLVWFHPDSLVQSRPRYATHIAITEVFAAGTSKPVATGETLQLAPDENFLEFQFSNLDYGFPRIDSFWYKLEGFDDGWHVTTEPKAIFGRVPPGEYTFRVAGTNRFGIRGSREATLRLYIRGWWWQSLWFKGLITATILSVFWSLWRNYSSRKAGIERDLRVRMQLKSLEALRGQLNHHFIKNVLGRSNSKILSNDVQEANQYLGQLASLMERILAGTRTDFYTLQDESKIIQNYLEIQQKRWRDKFETAFFMEPHLKEGTYFCPAMLVQPIVENAIEHGLLPKPESPCKLFIRWEEQEGNLKCTVTDTGVGLKPLTSDNTSHIGLSNVQERIRLINSLYKLNIQLTITETPGGGVTVVLHLPVLQVNPSLTFTT